MTNKMQADRYSDDEIKSALCNDDVLFLQEALKTIDVDYVFEDEDGDSLLLYSMSDRGSEMYKYLLNAGADIGYKNRSGEGALHSAVYSGDVGRVRMLMERYPSMSVEESTNEGETPLLLSVALCLEEIVDYLINAGANVNTGDIHGNTPLHLASYDGAIGLVKTLVEKGADLNARTGKGNKALALAINNEHTDVVRFLYSKMY